LVQHDGMPHLPSTSSGGNGSLPADPLSKSAHVSVSTDNSDETVAFSATPRDRRRALAPKARESHAARRALRFVSVRNPFREFVRAADVIEVTMREHLGHTAPEQIRRCLAQTANAETGVCSAMGRATTWTYPNEGAGRKEPLLKDAGESVALDSCGGPRMTTARAGAER
jgi:hypothetical protein